MNFTAYYTPLWTKQFNSVQNENKRYAEDNNFNLTLRSWVGNLGGRLKHLFILYDVNRALQQAVNDISVASAVSKYLHIDTALGFLPSTDNQNR
ncbi:hypothetical protein CXF95_24355 [Paraglaciecola sp. MB-3u-78]|nr:hypothetical protein CXF95_24355 [Paraglaciecola sp. MB-3u-78]